jgi:hypothetical protein
MAKTFCDRCSCCDLEKSAVFFGYLTLEREDITLLWNVGNHLSNDAASDGRRREFSITALWKPQNSHHQYSQCTVSFTQPRKRSLRITVAKWLTHLVAHMCTKQMSHRKRPVWWRPVQSRPVPFPRLSLHSVRTYSCKHLQSLSPFVQKKAPTMRFRTRRWPCGCLSHVLPWHVSVKVSRFWLMSVYLPAPTDEMSLKRALENCYTIVFTLKYDHIKISSF